jgi:hypothetical protein
MGEIRWDFPPLGTGNEQGYTNGEIEQFKGKELIDNLAREIVQNSLDAKDSNLNESVIVEFKLIKVVRDDYPVFTDYSKCLAGCNTYWGARADARLAKFLNSAQKTLQKKTIPVLVVSDYKTTGLTGVRAKKADVSAWRALAHSDGTSVNKNSDGAGSYGVGKNAPFACSSLSTVFYNTRTNDNEEAFQGTARLATTINARNEETQGIGHYLCFDEEDKWHPIYPQDTCSFRDLFKRDEPGTDIIILGFEAANNWATQIRNAVIANFFLAIRDRKLVIKVNDEIIDDKSIGAHIEGFGDSGRIIDEKAVYECWKALEEPDDGLALLHTVLEKDDFAIFLKADSSYHNYIAYFRSSGMRIWFPKKNHFQKFAAVAVVKGKLLNELLRKAEPVRHNRWDSALITDDVNERQKAKQALNSIQKFIQDTLDQKYKTVINQFQDSGEGDYLPDDAEDSNGQQIGTDVLRVNQRISSSSIRKAQTSQTSLAGSHGKGEPVSRDAFGSRKRRKRNQNESAVVGEGDTEGMKPSANKKTLSVVSIIDLLAQRAYIINESTGLYRVTMLSDKDYSKVFLRFFAVGEDNATDSLAVEKCMSDSHTIPVRDGRVGPISLEKSMKKDLFVTFELKEKMMLEIDAEEVIDNEE